MERIENENKSHAEIAHKNELLEIEVNNAKREHKNSLLKISELEALNLAVQKSNKDLNEKVNY